MHASIHTPKKQPRMRARVYARENLLFVRPRRYADDNRPPVDIFSLFPPLLLTYTIAKKPMERDTHLAQYATERDIREFLIWF